MSGDEKITIIPILTVWMPPGFGTSLEQLDWSFTGHLLYFNLIKILQEITSYQVLCNALRSLVIAFWFLNT